MIAQTPTGLMLLDLPDEVLICIFGFLDFRALGRASLACKHFADLAEPFKYRGIEITTGHQASGLASALHDKPNRATWIRSLLISTKFGDDHGLVNLPPHLTLMSNLEHLCLETPDCNAKVPEERVNWVSLQERYERVFEAASAVVPKGVERVLPHLKTCTLHFVDGMKEIYSMRKYAMLFLHPTLKSLTMSCASTDYPYLLLPQFQNDESLKKSTSLEHLHLEECDVHGPSLDILLSFPRALKSLKISEGIRYDGMFTRNSRLHGNVKPIPFVEAVATNCVESLEYLSLSLGYARPSQTSIHEPGHHLNLTEFLALKHLDLDVRTANLIRVRQRCDHSTYRRLPPNLETLKVFGIPLGDRPPFDSRRRVWFPFDTCFIVDKAQHGVGLLKNLVYSYEYYREEDESRTYVNEEGDTVEEISPILLGQRLMVEKCKELQPLFKRAAVRLEVETIALPNGFIPPYLFTEDKPKRSLLWESGPPLESHDR